MVFYGYHSSFLVRSFLNVPLRRNNGTSVITNSGHMTTVSDKTLIPPDFLSIEERVVARNRISLFLSYQQKIPLFFPKWDLNGADLPHFGKWIDNEGNPWLLDSNKMTIDAKKTCLQIIEAGLYTQNVYNCPVRIVIQKYPKEIVIQRKWDFGLLPYKAFCQGLWQAVHSTATYHSIQVYFVGENPLPVKGEYVTFINNELDDEFGGITILCEPIDVFESLLGRHLETIQKYIPMKQIPYIPTYTIKSTLKGAF